MIPLHKKIWSGLNKKVNDTILYWLKSFYCQNIINFISIDSMKTITYKTNKYMKEFFLLSNP